MKRLLFFVYGVTCYLLFLGIFAYMAGFAGNFLVPKSIDSIDAAASAETTVPLAVAVIINITLLSLFALQHSVMARPAFKRIWTQIVPEPIERSTYVLLTCVVTALLMWRWQPMNAVVWDVHTPWLRSTLWTMFAIGWLAVPLVSLLINHFDLFGLRQVWLYLRGKEYAPLPFRTPLVYRRVRHPLYLAWAMFFWATPTMTAGHLLFAGVLTLYMGLAAIVEERDLIAHFGEQYRAYRRRVPMFVPNLGATSEAAATATTNNGVTETAAATTTGNSASSAARVPAPSRGCGCLPAAITSDNESVFGGDTEVCNA